VALLGFTSGTTGKPKATMHFHRDLLIIADGYAKEVLGVTPDDVFVGSPPLAFTFGLGGLAVFPLRFGAAATLLETASPANMIEIIETYKATVCFTAPTAYRAMLRAMEEGADLSSLRAAVSAGETLPGPVYEEWMAKTGKPMLDGIGATEMLHIFISNRFDELAARLHRASGDGLRGGWCRRRDERGATRRGRPAGGARADRMPLPQRSARQKYVRDGWNLTGDSFTCRMRTAFPFRRAQRRHDHFRRLQHRRPRGGGGASRASDVAECAVIGVPTRIAARSCRRMWCSIAALPPTRRAPSGCRITSRRSSHPTSIPVR
jgi:2-aminobenzoate-CoA ligase